MRFKLLFFCVLLLFVYSCVQPGSIDEEKNYMVQTKGPNGGSAKTIIKNLKTGTLFAHTGRAIFTSKDNGENWFSTSFHEGKQTYITELKTNDYGDIWVATDRGLFKSTDDGASWEMVFKFKNIYSLEINSNQILYISTSDVFTESNYNNLENKLFRSVDNGESWLQIGKKEFGDIAIYNIFSDKNNNLIARTSEGKLFYSYDYGNNWNSIQEVLENRVVDHAAFDNDGNIFCVVDSDIYLLEKNNSDFQLKYIEFSKNIHIYFLKILDNKIFARTINGVFYSDTDNIEWKSLEGFNYVTYINIINNRYYMSAGGKGIYTSDMLEGGWSQSNFPASKVHILKEDSNKNIFAYSNLGRTIWKFSKNEGDWDYFGSYNGYMGAVCYVGESRVYSFYYQSPVLNISNNNGKNWKLLKQFNQDLDDIFHVSGDIFYIVKDRSTLIKSTNGGADWNTLNFPEVLIFSFHKSNNATLYVGTSNGIFKSTNEGVDWDHIGLENKWIHSIYVNSFGKIFAGGHRLYYSADDGASWEAENQINTIGIKECITSNQTGYIFLKDIFNLYCSKDEGENWEKIFKDFEFSQGEEFLIDSEGFLYIYKNYRGVFRSKYSTNESNF